MLNYKVEQLAKKANNRYALTEIISKRARQIKHNKENMLVSEAIHLAIEDFENDSFDIDYKK